MAQLMQTWFDDGRGGGWVYGVVVASGPKMKTILWESGRRNRVRHDSHLVEPVPERCYSDAVSALHQVWSPSS